jgi:GNAT superfamily N-acetyltransferase
MSDGVRVRAATTGDREAAGRLWMEMIAFHREFDSRFSHLKPDAVQIWLRYFDDCLAGDQVVLVAETGGEVVGLAVGRVSEDAPFFEAAPHCFIATFVVAAESRRRGVGRELFEGVVEACRRRGVAEVRLGVVAGNPVSNAFWRELGFEPYQVSMRWTAE